MLPLWLKDHWKWVKHFLFALSALPAVVLVVQMVTDSLGENPLAQLTHVTGRSALLMLAVTLCITPLRRLACIIAIWTHQSYGKRVSDWNWLVRLRRMLGLWSFVYAFAHSWLYVQYDLGFAWGDALADLREKPYLQVGALTLLILLVLAATSTNAMMRRLGKSWRLVHTSVYAAALLGVLHFWWTMKPGLWRPWPDTLLITVLLGYRMGLRVGLIKRWDGFEGQESHVRPNRPVANSGN